jgi:PAT family beta-lactamase induction signal transducer AmpG
MTAPARRRASFEAYLRPRTLLMLVLGFSSGMPFMLVGGTMSYWMRDLGASHAFIGYASGVGLAYSLKFLWAPIIDRVNAPLLGFLGRRRSWIAFAQIAVGIGLIGMAIMSTVSTVLTLVLLSGVVAFASATQDIVIDAWRIEIAENADELGLLTSAETFGYRMALLLTDAVILILADHIGWALSYSLSGVLVILCIVATIMAAEPKQADVTLIAKESQAPLTTWRGIFDAVAGPFISFFKAHGWMALLMLAAIALYRLPEFLIGPMVNPFYADIGLTKTVVGEVRGLFGLLASLGGIWAGGFAAVRFGHMRALVIGGVLQATSIAAFALLALLGARLNLFISIMTYESFSSSFAGISLVAYMSSLTSLGYTASQYALLTSAYTLFGKSLKTLSGTVIDAMTPSLGQTHAYATFFVGAGLIGVPAILLFMLLAARQGPTVQQPAPA